MTKEARAFVRKHGTTSGQPPAGTGSSRAKPTHRPTAREYVRGAFSPIPHDYMPGWTGPFWTWLIVAGCVGRGTDLILAPNESHSDISAWVNVLGYNTYGWLFCAAAIVLAAAKLWGRIGPVTIGIAIAAGVNLMYAIALLQGVLLSPGPITGWRFVTPPLLATALAVGRLLTLVAAARRVRR